MTTQVHSLVYYLPSTPEFHLNSGISVLVSVDKVLKFNYTMLTLSSRVRNFSGRHECLSYSVLFLLTSQS